ncbi:MAG TPA: hypothetical protein VK162_14145 [Streptosporangiaceae bacterium]|nr:hypothetical protein [Streptosporangiaceae bacterium]
MGRIIMLVVGAFLVFVVAAWIIHVLLFFFWIALIAVAGFSLFRFARWSSARRSRS